MIRLFTGIDISNANREKLASIRETNAAVDANWIPAANYHITTFFIGDVPEVLLDDISSAAAKATDGVEAFTLKFEGLEWKRGRRQQMLWVRFAQSAKFKELTHKLSAEMQQLN